MNPRASTMRTSDAERQKVAEFLRDACADGDAEVHRVLTEKVFPRQAEVVDVAAWTAEVGAAAAHA